MGVRSVVFREKSYAWQNFPLHASIRIQQITWFFLILYLTFNCIILAELLSGFIIFEIIQILFYYAFLEKAVAKLDNNTFTLIFSK